MINPITLADIVTELESGKRPQGGASLIGDVVSVGGEHLDGAGGFCFESVKYIPQEFYEEMGKGRITDGDILIVKDGATTGKVSMVDEQFPYDEAAVNEHVFRLRVDEQRAFPRFVYWFLRSRRGQVGILADYHGAAIGGIGRTFVTRVQLPLPALEEQRHIAAILDKAHILEKKCREAGRVFEKLLESEFLSRFGEMGETKYPLKALGEVCSKITDGVHKTPTYIRDGVPFLRVTDIQDPEIDWPSTKKISQEEYDYIVRYCRPEKGDVLLSKNGTIGIPKLVTWERQFATFVSLALLKPNRKVLTGEYLESFLLTKDAMRQATQHAKTLTVTNLHLNEIAQIRIPLPPLSVQSEWVEYRKKIVAVQNKFAMRRMVAKSLHDSIAKEYF